MRLLCFVWVLLGCVQQGATARTVSPDTFRLAISLPVAARYATADNLGNLYIITTENTIEKYGPAGNLLTRYSNRRRGNALSLDVRNPLKVVVWYADFRMVVFLDRSLTLLGELNLIEAGYPEVRTVAAAADGNLWVYDEVNFRLVKITPEGEKIFESQALSQLLPGPIGIVCIRDDNNRVCAADPAQGLLEFDAYAQFQRLIAQKGIRDFQLTDTGFAWVESPFIRSKAWRGFDTIDTPWPGGAPSGTNSLWLAGRYLLAADADKLEVYAWE